MTPNGKAVYKVARKYTRNGISRAWTEHETDAAITPKRVTTTVLVFDRSTGDAITSDRLSGYVRRLVAYRLNTSGTWTRPVAVKTTERS